MITDTSVPEPRKTGATVTRISGQLSWVTPEGVLVPCNEVWVVRVCLIRSVAARTDRPRIARASWKSWAVEFVAHPFWILGNQLWGRSVFMCMNDLATFTSSFELKQSLCVYILLLLLPPSPQSFQLNLSLRYSLFVILYPVLSAKPVWLYVHE